MAIAQLLTHIHDVIGTTMPAIEGVVIGGDFNTNHDQAMFAAERTLDSLAAAGYQNGFEGLPLPDRVTHPGTHGFRDATFDCLFAKGLTATQPSIMRTTVSDHWPVTRDFRSHFRLKTSGGYDKRCFQCYCRSAAATVPCQE